MRWMKLLCVGFLHGGEIQFLDKPLFFNWILLGVGLWSSSHGFDFVHSRVEVLDVFWGVQTSRAVVMAGHDRGAKATERQSAPVVAGADAFYLLQIFKKWEKQGSCSVFVRYQAKSASAGLKRLWSHADWDMQHTVQTGQDCCCSFWCVV